MTVTINGSTGIDKVQDGTIQSADFAAGVPAASDLPAGTVLQVVQGTYATQTSTTSSTFTDTGITATITPISATSKILVSVSNVFQLYRASGNVSSGNLKLVRNGLDIYVLIGGSAYLYAAGASSVNGTNVVCFSYLDSPATTTACVYKVQQNCTDGSVYSQSNNSPSTIILMEIAA